MKLYMKPVDLESEKFWRPRISRADKIFRNFDQFLPHVYQFSRADKIFRNFDQFLPDVSK